MARPRNPLGDPVGGPWPDGKRWRCAYYPSGFVDGTIKTARFRSKAAGKVWADAKRAELLRLRARTPPPNDLTLDSPVLHVATAYLAKLQNSGAPAGTFVRRRSVVEVWISLAGRYTGRDLAGNGLDIFLMPLRAAVAAGRGRSTIEAIVSTWAGIAKFGAGAVAGWPDHCFGTRDKRLEAVADIRRGLSTEQAQYDATDFSPVTTMPGRITTADVPSWAQCVALADAVSRWEHLGWGACPYCQRPAEGRLDADTARSHGQSYLAAATTGARPGETLGLHVNDRLGPSGLVVRRQLDPTRPYANWIPPKHGSTRTTIIHPEGIAIIDELGERTQGLLVPPTLGQRWWGDSWAGAMPRGGRLLRHERDHAIAEGAAEHELPPDWDEAWDHPHILRHRHASISLAPREAGGYGYSLALAQQVLGHKSPATLAIYMHATPEELAAVSVLAEFSEPRLLTDDRVDASEEAATFTAQNHRYERSKWRRVPRRRTRSRSASYDRHHHNRTHQLLRQGH